MVQVREGPVDLGGREGRVSRALDGARQLRIFFHSQVERLQTDQLAFPVEVGGDDQGRGVGGKLLDRTNHRLGRLGLDQRSIDQLLRLYLTPFGELDREIHLDDVAFETHGYVRPSFGVLETIVGDFQMGVFLDPISGQDPGYLPCGVVLLGDYQSQGAGSSSAVVSRKFARRR